MSAVLCWHSTQGGAMAARPWGPNPHERANPDTVSRQTTPGGSGQRSTRVATHLTTGISMRSNKVLTGIAAAVAAAGLIGTGAALSNAATTPSPAPTTAP